MSCKLNSIKSNQIRRYRKKRYLRQRDVSKRMELKHRIDLYRWEKGEIIPSLINALKLSAALDCPVEILFIDHYKQIRQDMYSKK